MGLIGAKSVPNLPFASHLVTKIGAGQKRGSNTELMKPSIIKQRNSLNRQIRKIDKVMQKSIFCG